MDGQEPLSHTYLKEAIGIPLEIVSNDFTKFHGNESQNIVFQINEEEPDLFALSILFTLSLLSFTYAAPRGYSENYFVPDEEWNLEYFLQGLEFAGGHLKYSGDYISGRQIKTTIIYEPGGRIVLNTRNRGKVCVDFETLDMTGAPILTLAGGKDTWMPASTCSDLGVRLRSIGYPIKNVIYPEASHLFDAKYSNKYVTIPSLSDCKFQMKPDGTVFNAKCNLDE